MPALPAHTSVPSSVRSRIATSLTSRRGAWVWLGAGLLVIVALFGLFTGTTAAAQGSQAPVDSESARVNELLEQFPNADRQSVLVVASRADSAALTSADLDGLTALLPALDTHSEAPSSGPILSDDSQAALIVIPIAVGDTNAATATTIDAIRAELADHTPDGIVTQVTGGPAFKADIAAAFDGADFTLLLVTIVIVALLLIVTYRSPVLWLVPLLVIALADGLAGRATAAAGAALGLQFDAGIISVLVFGAGTNYALLLISRYREELQLTADHRRALSTAWQRTVGAILASNLTVVLALLTLVLAVIPGTHGIGVSSAIGLIIALAAVLFVLPPFLAVCGRRIFWPFVPRPGQARRQGRMWRALATRVVGRPVVSLVGGAMLLGIMAAGLLGTTVGLDQAGRFRVASESAAALDTVAAHFPAGETQPIWVVTATDQADEVLAAIEEVDGIVRAHPVAADGDGLTKLMVTSEYAPSTPDSLAQITALRDAVHAIPEANAVVGGGVATDLDARSGNARDLWIIAPLILAVSFLVLLILLRSIVAPVVLLVINLASSVAAIGAGAWLSRVVFGQPALDAQVPLLAFLFLVALGIDYTIFLVHRARTEAKRLGTRAGMVEAVTHTGSVITSAGLVLAAVFAALGVLPLVVLGQLGLIVGVGVIVDTLVVRTVIVLAVFSLLGDRIWWPGRLTAQQGELTDEPRQRTAAAH